MSDGEPAKPLTRGHPGVLVGILIALALVLLRMCDAEREAELSRALSGAGLGGSGGGSAVGAFALYLGVAVATIYGIARAFDVPGRATWIVILLSAVAAIMVIPSTAEIASRRSHAVDSWSLCEKPGNSPQSYPVYVSTSTHPPSFYGPHLPGGDPCVELAEQRDVHAREHPDGDFVDGIKQVLYRFRTDRARVIYIPAALMLGLVIAVVLTIASERRRTR